jgi:hypothetical protein
MNRRIILCLFIPSAFFLAFWLSSCIGTPPAENGARPALPPKPQLKTYVCYRATGPLTLDGKLDDQAWQAAPWTDHFSDIEGSAKPSPKYATRAKLIWDDQNLYIAAELEEPHVWARLKQRDTVIFYDNDFEVFIDPDGDTHAYYELEVNAIATAWDLLLLKPYRHGGPPVNGWDIAGLQVATHVNGTLNDASDTDKGWSVEIKIPLVALSECAMNAKPPKAGDQWRINFSRVEWRTIVEDGNYRKVINPQTGKPFPEDNWVWSPQGRINMHMPEMWGYTQFSPLPVGSGSESFRIDPDIDVKWALRQVYYAEFEYYATKGVYTTDLAALGLQPADFPAGLPLPVIRATNSTFECHIPLPGINPVWTIYHDSRIVKVKMP